MPAATRQSVPQFMLYGEAHGGGAEYVHIETIESRSRLYNWHIGAHTHQGLFQVLFLMAGHVSADMDGAVWECGGPTVITVHPSVVHGFVFSEAAMGYVLTLDQNLVHAAAGRQGGLFAPLFTRPLAIGLHAVPQVAARVQALLEQLMAEATWTDSGHNLMLEWLSQSVLMLLLRVQAQHAIAGQSGRQDIDLFNRFRALVEVHFREQWQVAHYAAALHVTPSRLTRLCLKLQGKSAFDLAQDRLMLEACRKLTYVPAGLASIAYELGFQDPAYFSRLFKKHTGQTPKQYRTRTGQRSAVPSPDQAGTLAGSPALLHGGIGSL